MDFSRIQVPQWKCRSLHRTVCFSLCLMMGLLNGGIYTKTGNSGCTIIITRWFIDMLTLKKFLAIALILAAAGCARKEAGPVRYDRMELIYYHIKSLDDGKYIARDKDEAISMARQYLESKLYRAFSTVNVTGQDTLSFISSRIYSAKIDTLPSQSPYIKMVALLRNEDRTDTLSSTMWFEGELEFNGTPIRDTSLYVYLLDICRDRGALGIYFYYDGCHHWYPKGYSRQFPEGVDQSIRDSLFSWRDTMRFDFD